MSLKIYYGSRIESLAEKLVEELKAERQAKGPFEFLEVAVANPNLGNWLKMKVLAKVPELSAGIEMPFLDDRLAELVKAYYGGSLELISGREYPAFVLDALMNHWREEFVPFRKYVKEDFDAGDKTTPLTIQSQREARKAVQLSDNVAQMIDSYEATGYLGLLEESKDKNEVYCGEQVLAETLFGAGGREGLLEEQGKISFRQLFDIVKGKKPDGDPKRIVLFGQTSLTDLQIRVLVWLSQTHEINWYCPANVNGLNNHSFSDSEGGVAAYNVDVDKTIHKLCQCLKDTFGNTIYSDERIFKPHASDSVLSRLQIKFSRVGALAAAVKVPQDASVQIVGAPGIRREVEMVYNAILGAVWEKNENGKPAPKKGMSFSDIAVLVPDMSAYRPMIEAVFTGRGQIPYGLVDATTQDYSAYLDGFLALMDIARYGLSRKRIFAALENPCVQRAMGFSRDDVISWLELTKDFGAFEGYKEGDSDEGNVSGHFNWDWALRRMRLGLVAQDIGFEKDSVDRMPLETRDVGDVYKFSEVVETLYRRLGALNCMEPASCSSDDAKSWHNTWAGRIHAVMDEFLVVDKDDGLETLVRSRIVRTLNGLTAISGVQSYKLPIAVVEHFVAGTECTKGGYLRHGVTIGGLRSLENVPFKQIFVLGLGEGGFPGRNDCSTLDVRNTKAPEERDDVLRPEENRARLRAAVLSAMDRLVLSYPNRELGSDAKVYPSSAVNDLKAILADGVIPGAFREFEGYPLTEFAGPIQIPDGQIRSAISQETVDGCFSGLLPSLSEMAYVLAGKRHVNGPDSIASAMCETKEKFSMVEPTPKDLAEFVKDPFTAILKRRLGIATEGSRDHCFEDVSPLGVQNGPPLWELQKNVVLGKFRDAFAKSQKEAHTPTEFLGDFAREEFKDIVDFWRDIPVVTDLDRKILASGLVSDAHAVVCARFSEGTDKAPINLPPSAVLDPLFERLKKCKDDGTTGQLEFTIKVFDVAEGGVYKKGARKGMARGVGCWRFMLDFSAADVAGYYDAVLDEYRHFTTAWEVSGTYPVFTYDELREYLKTSAGFMSDSMDWDLAAREIVLGRTDFHVSGALVVSRAADSFKREPTGKELKALFDKLYKVPMSGIKEAIVVNGGVR